jgi:cytochrome P450
MSYRANESDKMEDVFAMCASCAHEAEVQQGRFWKPRPFPAEKHKGHRREPTPVFGLRGDIDSWEEIQGTEDLFRDDLKSRKMVSIKANIHRLMGQNNVQFMDPEDWRRIFNELADEAVIRAVHRS